MSWTSDVEETIQIALDQIVNLSDWGKKMDLTTEVIAGLVQPYKNLIAEAHHEDIPLARILDEADLVIGQIEHENVDNR